MIVVDGLLYAVSDAGIASCWEAKTGKVVWSERVPDKYTSSILYADGRLYLHSEGGTTTVLKAAERLISRRRSWIREAQRRTAALGTPTDGEPMNRMARDGMAALERFGAELEAAFVRSAPQAAASAPTATEPARAHAGAERAELDVSLERQLLDDGIVVRGHDVARVVGLMTGRRVEWEE